MLINCLTYIFEQFVHIENSFSLAYVSALAQELCFASHFGH